MHLKGNVFTSTNDGPTHQYQWRYSSITPALINQWSNDFFKDFFPGIDTFILTVDRQEMGERGGVTCSKGPPPGIQTS